MNKQTNSSPLVSIIVNCFNGEKYLKKTLSSILEQTYQNWEVIFWDNQSSDNSKKIFYEFQDKRFKYFYSERHTSLYEARNGAINNSSGEIIAFLDTDDWWHKEKLDKQIKFFKDSKIGLVYSICYLYHEKTKKIKKFYNKILKSGFITEQIFKNYNIGILTVLLRKEAYKSVSGFDNDYHIIGDFDLITRLSLKWKFDCAQEPLAYYRIHDKNFSFLNKTTEIKELEKWILDSRIISNEKLKVHLHYIKKKILFLKTAKYIDDGDQMKALKNIFSFPLQLNKMKLILRLILPKEIMQKIRKFR